VFEKRKYLNQLEKNVGKSVEVAGWVYDVRDLGGIIFVLLRDKTAIRQITAPKESVSANILDTISNLRQEDVISVKGKVVKSKVEKVDFEIIPESIEVINKAETPLPLDPRGVTKTNLDTQLDWRVLHMRTKEARAIFKIQSEILNSFRRFLNKNGYLEINPPVIIASASEGGAELFSIPYFDKEANLAQSPQLYKQMCALSFEKVFTVLPIFRAEKFDQPTHLNEIRQMDMEQAFADDEDVIKVLEQCFVQILKDVNKNCKEELDILGQKLKIPRLPLKRVTYDDVIKKLQKAGEKVKWGDDFSKTQEKLLVKLVGKEAFVIKDWPTEIKAFYAMPYEKNPKICRAFDLIYNGIEVCSGTQRIHIPDLLTKQIESKGLNPEDFKFYIDFFRYGSPPHAGWSIGMERLTMQITDRKNIREVTMFPRDRNRITP
jgi:nondiscriminating aspartyl-tRNA synthetase